MKWENRENSLYKKLNFDSFVKAFAYCTQVALLAEKHQHHPVMTIDYNKVVLLLTTHDEGGKITQKDIDMANQIDAILT